MSDDRLLLALRANEMLVRAGLRSDWMPLGEKGSGQVDVRVMERSSSKVYWLIVQTPSIDEDISQADEEAEDSLYADAVSRMTSTGLRSSSHLGFSLAIVCDYFGFGLGYVPLAICSRALCQVCTPTFVACIAVALRCDSKLVS